MLKTLLLPPSLATPLPPSQRRQHPSIRNRCLRSLAATPRAIAREQSGGGRIDKDEIDPLSRLRSLLARADDPSSPEPEVDAAEEAAMALALELSRDGSEEEDEGEEGKRKKSRLLRGFGRAATPPRRPYSLADLRLARVEPSMVLSPEDATLNAVRDRAALAATAGAVAAAAALRPSAAQGVAAAAALFFAATLDAVAAGGGFGFLLLDSAARVFSRSYARRVAAHVCFPFLFFLLIPWHGFANLPLTYKKSTLKSNQQEAGHFLIAYLLGLLPRGYDLSSLEAFWRSRALNVQAGTRVCDVAFRREVSSGKLSSSSVDRAAAVALAGVAAEYCLFRRDGRRAGGSGSESGNPGDFDEIGESAEGGLGDVQQLDALLRALAFSQAKADSTVRYALLTAATLLRRHARAHARLAEAMLRGEGVVECVAAVEEELAALADDEI